MGGGQTARRTDSQRGAQGSKVCRWGTGKVLGVKNRTKMCLWHFFESRHVSSGDSPAPDSHMEEADASAGHHVPSLSDQDLRNRVWIQKGPKGVRGKENKTHTGASQSSHTLAPMARFCSLDPHKAEPAPLLHVMIRDVTFHTLLHNWTITLHRALHSRLVCARGMALSANGYESEKEAIGFSGGDTVTAHFGFCLWVLCVKPEEGRGSVNVRMDGNIRVAIVWWFEGMKPDSPLCVPPVTSTDLPPCLYWIGIRKEKKENFTRAQCCWGRVSSKGLRTGG